MVKSLVRPPPAAWALAWALAAAVAACGDNLTPPTVGLGSPVAPCSFTLDDLTVATTPLFPDYAEAHLEVTLGGTLCTEQLLTRETGRLTLTGGPPCGSFTLDLQYVSADGPCQHGYLYLERGTRHRSFTGVILAEWDEWGDPVDDLEWPYAPPRLLDQSRRAQWSLDDPLQGVGAWELTAEYVLPGTLRTGCPLAAAVELAVTSAATNLAPQVYHYSVSATPIPDSDVVSISVTAREPAAPELKAKLDRPAARRPTWHLTVPALDALREDTAAIRVAAAPPSQVLPSFVAWSPVGAGVVIEPSVDVTADQAAAPLATHLARLLASVTTPVREAAGPSGARLSVKAEASVSVPLDNGLTTVLPLALLAPTEWTFGPEIDDGTACAAAPEDRLSCALAAAILDAVAATGMSDPAASGADYLVALHFFGASSEAAFPALVVRQATVPATMVTD